MNVVFCWSELSGYMAACWRALASRQAVRLHVIAHEPYSSSEYELGLLDELSHRLITPAEQDDSRLVAALVAEQQPDIVVVSGWWLSAYRALIRDAHARNVRTVMGVDSPWRHEAQFLTRLRYWRTLRSVNHFMVTGERSWQYVRRLGVTPRSISRGLYGIDAERWNHCSTARANSPWPRRFLFLGRYCTSKGVDVLLSAYAAYRSMSSDPWSLVCCGKGPMERLLAGAPGVENLGFVQPRDLGGVFTTSGALILPSRFDPWPLAIVEAAAAGLPIVCSEACGSAVEVVRSYHNGLIVSPADPVGLAEAMLQIERREQQLAAWGCRSQQLAAAYAAEVWADRWLACFERLLSRPGHRA